jgi:hypothetical protein
MKPLPFLLAASVLFQSQFSSGASCCSSGASLPNLIVTDSRYQASATYEYSAVVGDVSTSGLAVFRSSNNRESSVSMKGDFSYLVSDFFQGGLSIPIVQRTREQGDTASESTGLGDVGIFSAYEYLPELEYSEFGPRGFVYLKLVIPTAPSIYDFEDELAADARSQGYYNLVLGNYFTRSFGRWDAGANLDLIYSFGREFKANSGKATNHSSTYGLNSALGLGHSFLEDRALRLGTQFSVKYMADRETEINGDKSQVDRKIVWPVLVSASYLIDSKWSLKASYTDETLVGPVRNSAISRSLLISLETRDPL